MDGREDGLGDLLGQVGVSVKGFDDLMSETKERRDEEGKEKEERDDQLRDFSPSYREIETRSAKRVRVTHLLNSNRLLSLPPSIVVGRSTDESVRDLSLSSELGFRDGGHVDDVSSPLSVHLGLSSGLCERRKKR